jgi:hypothetical protein
VPRIRSRCRSFTTRRWSRHSVLIVLTNRSEWAFAFGARNGVLRIWGTFRLEDLVEAGRELRVAITNEEFEMETLINEVTAREIKRLSPANMARSAGRMLGAPPGGAGQPPRGGAGHLDCKFPVVTLPETQELEDAHERDVGD